MKSCLSFKKHIFIYILTIVLNNSISMCWGSSSDDGVNDITEGVEKVSFKEKQVNSEEEPKAKNSKPVHSFTLARFNKEKLPLIQYTQLLTVGGEEFKLNRKRTREMMDEVMKASKNKTFLLAHGICMSADTYYPDPFTITQSFFGCS